MIVKITLLFFFIISLVAIVALYALKMATHFAYLRAKSRVKKGEFSDFYSRKFIDKKDAQRWKDAWMIFPLMFPIALEEERSDLNDWRQKIKRIHLAIYVALIVALLVGIYASKAFPEGLF